MADFVYRWVQIEGGEWGVFVEHDTGPYEGWWKMVARFYLQQRAADYAETENQLLDINEKDTPAAWRGDEKPPERKPPALPASGIKPGALRRSGAANVAAPLAELPAAPVWEAPYVVNKPIVYVGPAEPALDGPIEPIRPEPELSAAPRGAEAEKIVDKPNDPATWPPWVKDAFIAACERGELIAELARICGRPKGSVTYLLEKYLPDVNARRIAAIRERASVPLREPAKIEPAPAPEPVNGTLSPALLKFLREEVKPIFEPLEKKITVRDGSKLLLDGQPIALDALVEEANRILVDGGHDRIEVPQF